MKRDFLDTAAWSPEAIDAVLALAARVKRGEITGGLERKVLALHRRYDGGPGDDVIVVINFSHADIADCVVGVPAEGTWRVRFNSDSTTYSPDFNDRLAPDFTALAEPADGLGYRILTGLAPYSIVILSQDAVTK